MKHQGALAVCFPGRAMLFLLFTLVVAATTHAAETPGVTENSVLIGSCSALDGPARFLGNQTVLGATTTFIPSTMKAEFLAARCNYWPSMTATTPTKPRHVLSA